MTEIDAPENVYCRFEIEFLRGSMAFSLLPFNDMKSQECTKNFDIKKQSSLMALTFLLGFLKMLLLFDKISQQV